MASEEGEDARTKMNGDTELSKPFDARELDLIRNALQELPEQSRAQKGIVDAETEDPKVDEEIQDVDGIERLLKKVQAAQARQTPLSQGESRSEEFSKDDEGANEFSEKELQQGEVPASKPRETDISKRIARQNTVTQVVLGFIIASSFIWRWVVVKSARQASDSLQHPLQGMFDNVKESAENAGNSDND